MEEPIKLPRYRRVIRPNRSLSRSSARLLGCVVLAAAAVMSLLVISIGAWPIVVFILLELALVGAVFYVTAAHRRDFELLFMDEARFKIIRRCGHERHYHEFQRYWAKVHLDHAPVRLWVASHGKAVEVGSYLTEEARRSLALDLKRLLH